jgi:SulP family sulfate permease
MNQIKPGSLLIDVSSGLLAGAMTLTISISMAALIFSAPANALLPLGIAMALISAVITGIAINLNSSWKQMVAGPQSTSSVIMAIGIGTIYSRTAASYPSDTIQCTILCFVILSAFVVGITLFLLGRFRMGRMVRYIPYPVLGGFLSGTGWLIVTSAYTVMSGHPPAGQEVHALFAIPQLLRWLPGVGLALLLLLFTRSNRHILRLPAVLLAATALFYAVLWAMDIGIDEAARLGFVLKPYTARPIDAYLVLFNFTTVPSSLLLEQSWTVITMVVIVSISILLNASSLEMITQHDMDLDRELRAAGIGNVASAICGGLVGYQMLAPSACIYIGGGRSRLASLMPAVLCALVLLWGGHFLQYFPVALIGGYLMYIGFLFLYRWLYQSFFYLRTVDYGIIVVIFLTIVAIGFIEGLLVGILTAILLFTFDYSKLDVVNSTLSGQTHRSNVERPESDSRLLDREGERIQILCLRGYLFFGSAYTLFLKIKKQIGLHASKGTYYLLFDLHQLQGIDASALYYFRKMIQFVEKKEDVFLILTQISADLERSLKRLGIFSLCEGSVKVFKDLDRGLEWCENQVLNRFRDKTSVSTTAVEPLDQIFQKQAHVERFLYHLLQIELPAGEFLFRKGDPSQELFYLGAGQLSVVRERENQNWVRYRKIGPGAIVGEMGFYTRQQRSASVIATHTCQIFSLDQERFQQMHDQNPEIAFQFQNYLIQLLSKRLNQKTSEITNLLY